MNHLRNGYADVLAEKRILFVPSCLIVEMMTSLHTQVAAVNLSGSLQSVTPDLLILLRRMGHNIRVTAEAYEQGRIRHFIGDWRDDKLRARKLFFNIMSSLGYVSELLERVERNILFAAIEGVTAEWTALDRLMDAKAEERDRECPASCGCASFCDCNADDWLKEMADRLLAILDSPESDSADCLLLVCYNHSKRRLASALAELARSSGAKSKPSPNSILSVSKEREPLVCGKCAEQTLAGGVPFSSRIGACGVRTRLAGRKLAPLRYVMPPSIASLSPGRE